MSSELSIMIIMVAIFLVARMVHPGKAQQGEGLSGDSMPIFEADVLKVATFNVQTGKSLDGKRDIQKSAHALAGADIVGVQEVYAAGWMNKLGAGSSQTDALANPGGFAHLFAATRYRWFREQRGNLLLSKLAAQDWRIDVLPDQSRKSPRNMTVANFNWQGQQIVFINTHLHTGKGRETQLRAVLEEFAKHPRAVLAGDFNSKRDTPLLLEALADPTIVDAIQQAGLDLENHDRIDWILSRGFKVIDGEMLEKGISDHPFYQVSLSLEN
jgi:endonuclease/exonuclease/phosphatase family metal-dependent hydrolase